MAGGKTIKIYLADGTVSGVRHGQIDNWTGQSISCPRTRFGEFKEWPEARRPGVYFLFGVDEEGRDIAYIGEAEIVIDRISSHISDKDFWNELVAFTSKDDNLTKAHVRYLESRLVQLASGAGRYILTNMNSPQLPALPRSDRDAMEEFIESVRVLLGVLGHRALESLTQRVSSTSPTTTPPALLVGNPISSDVPFVPIAFYLRVGSITASATRTDEGIVVLAGSEAARDVQSSLSMGYRSLREKLLASGVLEVVNGKLRFSRDNLFSSPSQAAAIIVGYSINGRDAWRTKDGRTWGNIEEANAEKILSELNKS